MSLQPGAKVGRYEIVDRLGQGGMAAVYKARDPSLDRVVALKVIRTDLTDDPEFLERFRREARAVARLDHPNVVQVFEFAEADGTPFLAMQYLEGGTLKQRVAAPSASGKRLPQEEAVEILGQVADALAYAHARGIVHRDVKPANVMLTSGGRAVVTDFGIAKIVSGTQYTQTGVGIGTPEYMSPEQGQGEAVDARSDVYSLGVMAYELLTGRLPFTADTPVAVVIKQIREPLPAPSSVDPAIGPALERALTKALAKDPKDRFQTAAELGSALREAVGRRTGLTEPTIVLPSRKGGRSLLAARRPVVAGIGAALLLMAGGVVIVGQVGPDARAPSPTPPLSGATTGSDVSASLISAVLSTPTPTPAPTATSSSTIAATATAGPQGSQPIPAAATFIPTPPPTPPPATATPAPAITGPRSVQMEKSTISASTEKFGVIVSNYPNGTEVVLVSSRSDSGYDYPLGLRFSTNSNPYVIRSDWSGPIGKYTLHVTAAGTPYDLPLTVTP